LFFKTIREAASEEGLTIPAFLYTTGSGCYNLAFEAVGEDVKAEKLANMLTMALMPAKWTTFAANEKLPEIDSVVGIE
jgi:hypothetical protein